MNQIQDNGSGVSVEGVFINNPKFSDIDLLESDTRELQKSVDIPVLDNAGRKVASGEKKDYKQKTFKKFFGHIHFHLFPYLPPAKKFLDGFAQVPRPIPTRMSRYVQLTMQV